MIIEFVTVALFVIRFQVLAVFQNLELKVKIMLTNRFIDNILAFFSTFRFSEVKAAHQGEICSKYQAFW
jgi:hypothetical protein